MLGFWHNFGSPNRMMISSMSNTPPQAPLLIFCSATHKGESSGKFALAWQSDTTSVGAHLNMVI